MDEKINVTWRKDAIQFKADPSVVYEELCSIGDNLKPEDVVNYARNESSELHKCFTWDDSAAAEKWRMQEARTIMHCLIIETDPEEGEEKHLVRAFYNTEADGKSYMPTEAIVHDKDAYQQLLEQAWAELERFKKKYSMLTELKDIFALIA